MLVDSIFNWDSKWNSLSKSLINQAQLDDLIMWKAPIFTKNYIPSNHCYYLAPFLLGSITSRCFGKWARARTRENGGNRAYISAFSDLLCDISGKQNLTSDSILPYRLLNEWHSGSKMCYPYLLPSLRVICFRTTPVSNIQTTNRGLSKAIVNEIKSSVNKMKIFD